MLPACESSGGLASPGVGAPLPLGLQHFRLEAPSLLKVGPRTTWSSAPLPTTESESALHQTHSSLCAHGGEEVLLQPHPDMPDVENQLEGLSKMQVPGHPSQSYSTTNSRGGAGSVQVWGAWL